MSKNEKSRLLRIAELLKSPDKKYTSAKTIFCRIFRIFMMEEEVDDKKYFRLMNRWKRKIAKTEELTSTQVSSNASNLMKELERNTMTPETFIKALQFLGCSSVEIKVTAKYPDGRSSHNNMTIDDIDEYLLSLKHERNVNKEKKRKGGVKDVDKPSNPDGTGDK
tara:strand:- start:17619 stop:18113 length:495 start_codon:yes stop_codon:yes gene_type:complete